ncbi:MAG TPA: TIGR02265 family protein [Anaeromyxobacteraceae bacterium]|nr:TIGR02265 family protein [Anaeromyxobacteraceae bacterium]
MDRSRKVKGTILVSRMKYLRVQGRDAVGAVLDRLTAEDRDLLDGMLLLPSAWYAAGILKRLDGAITAALAKGERSAMLLDLGQFSADTTLGPGGVLRPWLRDDDPHALLREVPRIHASQHGAGRRTYERIGERAAVVRTLASDGFEGDDCLTTVGWLKRAIELSGGRQVHVAELTCLSRGAPCCEYLCEWS